MYDKKKSGLLFIIAFTLLCGSVLVISSVLYSKNIEDYSQQEKLQMKNTAILMLKALECNLDCGENKLTCRYTTRFLAEANNTSVLYKIEFKNQILTSTKTDGGGFDNEVVAEFPERSICKIVPDGAAYYSK